MKQRSIVILSAIITLFTFAGITYTSCTKDRCKNANCLNGGVCKEGQCYCRDGYSGLSCEIKNKSTIIYTNKTFTKVVVTANGQSKMVDTGATISFTGDVGDSLKATVTAQGAFGKKVTLDPLSYVFPARGTVGQDLEIPNTYFFLKVVNMHPTSSANRIFVNYDVPSDSTLDILNPDIPNDRKPYFIGYYKATQTTKVRIDNYPVIWKSDSLHLPMTRNQVFNDTLR